jgi:hypothetical protein
MALVEAHPTERPIVAEFRAITDGLGRAALVGATAGVGAGAVAGFLSRVAMRVTGATSDPFLVTENGNVVGRVTLGGSVLLIVAGAIFGMVLGLSYVAIRRWLPTAPWPRRLATAVVSLAALGALLVNADNDDFTRLGDPVLNVALFTGLLLVTGVLLAVLAERIDDRIQPRPADPWFYSSVYLLIALVSVVLGPFVVVLAALPFIVLAGRALARRVGIEPSFPRGSPAWWAGGALLMAAAAVGLAMFGIEVSEILAAAG